MLCAILIALGGCAVTTPVLSPAGKGAGAGGASETEEQFRISVRPVMTEGFGSEDREQFEVDLSSHFNTFYIEIENGLSRSVRIDASQIFLYREDHPAVQAMSETESIEYYRWKGQPRPTLVLVPKSRKLEKMEIARIKKHRLRSAAIPPGGKQVGVVYFEKVLARDCERVSFIMKDIRIDGEQNPQEVRFDFNCDE